MHTTQLKAVGTANCTHTTKVVATAGMLDLESAAATQICGFRLHHNHYVPHIVLKPLMHELTLNLEN